MKRKKPDTLMK